MREPIYFDRANADGNQLIHWGPDKGTERLGELLPPQSSVLDVGAGSGSNSLYLAEQSHRVVALELNEGYARDGLHVANYLGSLATHLWVVGDAARPPIKGKFDAVACNKVLQFVDRHNAARTLNFLMNSTKPGGLNLVKVYTGSAEDQQKVLHRNLYGPTELSSHYKDNGWELEHYDANTFPMTQEENGKWWYSSYELFIARKPTFERMIKMMTGADAEYWRRSDPDYYETLVAQYS